MYTVPPASQPVTLFSDSGERWSYPSLLAFIEHHGLHWIKAYVGPHFRVYRQSAFERLSEASFYEEYSFFLRSCHGEIITAKDCVDAQVAARRALHPGTAWSLTRHCRYSLVWKLWNGQGPVPWTRKYKAGAHHRRLPKIIAVYRDAAGVLPFEGEPAPRGRRRKKYLPWDGRRVASRRDRSWKRNRATRWRSTKESTQ